MKSMLFRLSFAVFLAAIVLALQACPKNLTTTSNREGDGAPHKQVIVQQGHYDKIKSVDYSPDGKYVVVSGADERITIWDAASRKILHTMPGCRYDVRDVTFSHDGRLIAAACDDPVIKVWKVGTWKLEKEARFESGYEKYVSTVDFSYDDKLIAASRSDGEKIRALLYDVEKGEVLWDKPIDQQFSELVDTFVAFRPDGKFIAVARGEEGTKMILYSMDGSEETVHFPEENGWLRAMKISPDGETVVIATGQERLLITKSDPGASGSPIITRMSNWISSMVFVSDGKRLLVFLTSGHIVEMDALTGEILWESEDKCWAPDDVDLSPDGETIAGGTDWGMFWLMDLESKETIFKSIENGLSMERVFLDPDGKYMAILANSHFLLLDIAGRNFRPTPAANGSTAIRPDGKLFASSPVEGPITIWDPDTGNKVKEIALCGEFLKEIYFTTGGIFVVSSTDEEGTWLYEVDTGKKLFGLDISMFDHMVMSPDGKHFAKMGGWDSVIFDVPSGDQKFIEADDGMFAPIAFSASGGLLMLSFMDNVVMWDTKAEKALYQIEALEFSNDADPAGAFSPDGSKFAIAGSNNRVTFFDSDTGKFIGALDDFKDDINSLAFNRDGNIMVAACADRSVRVYDVVKMKLLCTIEIVFDHEEKKFHCIAFTPDGYFDSPENMMDLVTLSDGARIYGLDEIKDLYYRPGLLGKIMAGEKVR